MQMTEQEIVINYKRAENHKGQIKILSELNACPKDEIERILRENGLMKYFLKNKDMSVELPKIKKLLQEGKSQKDIAILYDTSQPKISEILKILDSAHNVEPKEEKLKRATKSDNEIRPNEPEQEVHEKLDVKSVPKLATGGIVKGIDISGVGDRKDDMPDTLIYALQANEIFKKQLNDNVNHPQHYCVNGLECLDIMEEVFGADKLQAFCVLNAFKYLFRFQRKNGDEDIKKAHFYLGRYIELMEKESVEK